MVERAIGETVAGLRPFVPCDDFELCKRFYADLGFSTIHEDERIAILTAGAHSFVLQNYRWPGAHENFVIQLVVDDVETWWKRIEAMGLAANYGVKITPPQDLPWGAKGARVIHLNDPTGILWHISQYGQ